AEREPLGRVEEHHAAVGLDTELLRKRRAGVARHHRSPSPCAILLGAMSDLPPETPGKRVVIVMLVAAALIIAAWILLSRYARSHGGGGDGSAPSSEPRPAR